MAFLTNTIALLFSALIAVHVANAKSITIPLTQEDGFLLSYFEFALRNISLIINTTTYPTLIVDGQQYNPAQTNNNVKLNITLPGPRGLDNECNSSSRSFNLMGDYFSAQGNVFTTTAGIGIFSSPICQELPRCFQSPASLV